jgi:uncharacterized protein (DUF427 family)
MALRLGDHLLSLHDRMLYEPVARRVRCSLGGVPVCDTTGAALVWEPRRVVPMYAVPEADLTAELVPTASVPVPENLPPMLGPVNFALHLDPGTSLDVRVGDDVAAAAAFRPDDPDLAGLVILSWQPFDWLEEDLPVTGHPHDAFKRIDVLPSSRHVVVSLDGVVLADTRDALALHETHLPVRWYLPREDVEMDLLVDSASRTICAYKGRASYFSLADGSTAGRDIAWTYPDPLHDAAWVQDRVCFYSERTDLTVDGVVHERPVTPWSSPADQARF